MKLKKKLYRLPLDSIINTISGYTIPEIGIKYGSRFVFRGDFREIFHKDHIKMDDGYEFVKVGRGYATDYEDEISDEPIWSYIMWIKDKWGDPLVYLGYIVEIFPGWFCISIYPQIVETEPPPDNIVEQYTGKCIFCGAELPPERHGIFVNDYAIDYCVCPKCGRTNQEVDPDPER